MAINVILADDHAVVRDGIRAVIERKAKDIKIVGEASNGQELIDLARKNQPDVFIIDISMPVINGIEASIMLMKQYPKCKIIILSMHDSEAYVEKAIQGGVMGYILKENATDEIVHAIYEVNMGRYYMTPQISKYIVKGFLNKRSDGVERSSSYALTPAERRILQLISEGYTDKDIAKQLKISLNTAHVHRNNIMHKLNLHKQSDLVRYALKEGISDL